MKCIIQKNFENKNNKDASTIFLKMDEFSIYFIRNEKTLYITNNKSKTLLGKDYKMTLEELKDVIMRCFDNPVFV